LTSILDDEYEPFRSALSKNIQLITTWKAKIQGKM